MFGLGTWELVIIALIVLVVFGGKRLPEMGRSLGLAFRELRQGTSAPQAGKAPAGDQARTAEKPPADPAAPAADSGLGLDDLMALKTTSGKLRLLGKITKIGK